MELLSTDPIEAYSACLTPLLAKACTDTFDYLLRTRIGEIWRFSLARLVGPPGDPSLELIEDARVVHGAPELVRSDESVVANWAGDALRFERGVTIRLSEIVWIADNGN